MWPMADSARLSLSLRLAATFLPGATAVPRADAIMLMACRLSTATILGWGFQQDVADPAAYLLVAALGVTSCPLPISGDSVAAAFAVPGLACDVSLVLAFSVASSCAAPVVGTMAEAYGQVVLRAPVGAEDVIRLL